MQASSYDTGSRVEFPALVNAVNSDFVMSAGSQITLPSLVTLSTIPGSGGGSLAVGGSGILDLPKLTSFESIAFAVSDNSRINVPLLTRLKSSTVSVSGEGVFPVGQLTSIDSSSIFASNGAKIVLPGITSFSMGESFDVDRFQASGVGSEIRFPNLASINNPSNHSTNSLRMEAFGGGLVEAIAVTSAVNTLLYASGDGSVIDAKGITQLPTVTILEESGGVVRRGGEGEGTSYNSHFFTNPDIANSGIYGPLLQSQIAEGEPPEGEGDSELEVLPQQFRYDPYFSQLVYQSDGRGNQTHYKIDPTNGNILAVTRSIGSPSTGAETIERTLGTEFKNLQLADLNNDQLVDLVYLKANDLYYALANPTGFGTVVKIGSAAVSSFVVVNLGGDSKPEIVATSSTQPKLFKWSSLATNGFGTPAEIAIAGFPQFIIAADIDKDGDSDVIVATDFGGTPNPTVDASIVVYSNDGAGSVTLASSNLFAIGPYRVLALAASDMDLDGHVDVAIQYESNLGRDSTILMLWGNGTSNLTLGGMQDRFLVVKDAILKASDVNGDGHLDILADSKYIPAKSGRPLFLTDTLHAPSSYYVPTRVELSDIVFADLNNDGVLDRIRAFAGPKLTLTSDATAGKIEIQFGRSNGGWERGITFDTDTNPRELRVGNFNNASALDLSYVSGPSGKLELRYDLIDQLFGVVGDADDEITRFTYLPNGLVDTVVDPLGRITDYDYDLFGRMVATTQAKGTAVESISRMEYDAATVSGIAGLPTAFIDPNGNKTQVEYDLMNRVTKTTQPDPDGPGPLSSSVSRMEYDAEGNLTTTVDPMGHTTTAEYDSRNRQVAVTQSDPDGAGPQVASRTETRYDSNGNPIAVIDPLGNTDRHQYDARNRLIASTDSLGGVTRYAYDRDNNMIALTDPVGNKTQFQYDSRNRMVAEVDPLGKQISYAYDGENNLIEKTDRIGRKTTYAYDQLGRVVEEHWVGTDHTISYSYDRMGNLVSISDRYSSLTYTYDALNRVRTVDNLGTPQAPRSILTYTYDTNGNVVSVTDTLDGAAGAVVNYAYDGLNRLSRVTQSGQGLSDKRVDLAYNQNGQYTQIQRFSDLTGLNQVITTQFDYDSANRLTKIDHLNAANAAVGFFHYAYDVGNRITRIDEIDGVVEYAYDRTDQLTAANYSDPVRTDEQYRYDANGNRLATHAAPTGYQTGTANRLSSDGVHNYQYDAEGNMTTQTMIATGAVRTFVWDHRNRLVSVTDKLADGTTQMRAEYTYDTMDRRIAKRVSKIGEPVSELHFIYDREDIIVDAGKEAGASAFEYTRYLHGGGIDEVFAEQVVGGNARWLLTDHLGSVRYSTTNNGDVINDSDYASFGGLFLSHPPSRHQFTSREFDAETGLNFYRARYYSQSIGQFVSEDPMGFKAGDKSLRRYVLNSPVHFTDAFGLEVDVNLINPGETLHHSLKNYTSSALSFAAHGNPHFVVGPNGEMLSPEEIVALIKQHPKYAPGVPINFISCESGQGIMPFAQYVANLLPENVVFAPNYMAWINAKGNLSVHPQLGPLNVPNKEVVGAMLPFYAQPRSTQQ